MFRKASETGLTNTNCQSIMSIKQYQKVDKKNVEMYNCFSHKCSRNVYGLPFVKMVFVQNFCGVFRVFSLCLVCIVKFNYWKCSFPDKTIDELQQTILNLVSCFFFVSDFFLKISLSQCHCNKYIQCINHLVFLLEVIRILIVQ